MNLQKRLNKKAISNALAMGLLATTVMPVVNTDDRVFADKTTNSQDENSIKLVEVTGSSVNTRKGPGTEYGKLGTLKRGTKVKYLSTCSNGWYKIEVNGSERYISNQYSSIVNGDSNNVSETVENITESDTVQTVGTVTASSLNVRNGIGTSYSVKTRLKRGSVVGILNTYNNGWVRVKLSDSSTGYVSGKYLKIDNGESSDINVSESQSQSTNNSKKVQQVLNIVKSQIGKPYVYGAAGPNSFDCSGLTYYAYKQVGVYLNRTSRDQSKNGVYVSKSDLKPGDLVFFNSGTSSIKHVGIYVGDGQFIHSPSTGKSVKYENLNSSYYTRGYVTARRIL